MDFSNWETRPGPTPNMKSLLMRVIGLLVAFALVLPLSAVGAPADSYPSKPVRLIIPFAPGGGNDVIGRLVAPKLSERLGKPIVVENRAGAAGVLGTEMVAKSAPDGYTLLIINVGAHASYPALYKLPYDHEKAFAPVAGLATSPIVLTIHPSVPANSVKELIALAKKQPGKLRSADAGIGTNMHLMSELFKKMAGIDFMTVHFKGGGPGLIDLLGGHSHMSFNTLSVSMPHIKSGKLKVLGVGGKKRSPMLPDVPTISEAGVPGYEATSWWGILAPAGTPKAIIDRLNKELAVTLISADLKKRFEDLGGELEHMGSVEFGEFITAETAKCGKIIKEGNIKVE